MIEENNNAEFPIDPNETNPEQTNEENTETNTEAPEASEPTRRKVTRRRVKKTKPPVEHTAEPKLEKKLGEKEIDDVLTNLYGERDEESDTIQEVTMQKNGILYKLSLTLGICAFLAAVVWAGLIFMPQQKNDQSQVDLSINGPTELSLGATSTYVLSYANNSAVPLKNVVLNALYPDGFVFLNSSIDPNNAGHNEWDIGTLQPYQKGTITVSGLPFGSLNDQKSWRIFLDYLPTNFNSELRKSATLTTAISDSPIKLTITGPDQVSLGTDVEYDYSIQADSGWSSNIGIIPGLPSNFIIGTSTPPLKNGVWIVNFSSTTNNLPILRLTGKFAATDDKSSPIKGQAVLQKMGQSYQIASAQLTSALVKNDVSVNLAINGTISDFDSRPGDVLNVSVRIKNLSKNEINNASIKLTLTAPADGKQSLLKWSDIVDKNDGNIQGEQVNSTTRRGILTWTSANIPALSKLKPNAEVTADLQIPIKDAKDFDLSKIRNSAMNAIAEAKFKDSTKTSQTVTTKPINITLNSDLSFSNPDDITGQGQNGEKHTVTWVVNNNFHAIQNLTVTAKISGDVGFETLDKGVGDLIYDPSQHTITWTVEEMPVGTDLFSRSFVLTINKQNPTQTQLLSTAHLTATDSVTGKTIDLAGEEIKISH